MKALQQIWYNTRNIAFTTNTWKAIFLVIIILLIGLLGLRACSGGGMSTPTVYRIARDGTWGYLQLSEKGRNLLAFSNELLFAIAKQENMQLELFLVSPETLFQGLDRNQYDGVLSAFLPRGAENEKYEKSKPVFLTGPVLIVQDSSPARSLQEMGGKVIGIQTGSSVVFNIEQYPEILLTSYDTPLQALSSLAKNEIDGAILGLIPAYIYTTGFYAGRLKVITRPLTDEGVRLISLRNPHGKKLVEFFNKGLAKVRADGTYDALLAKWGLFNPELAGNGNVLAPDPKR